jgi:hypothetical protein
MEEIRHLKEEIEKLKGMLSREDVLTCTAPKTQNHIHLGSNELVIDEHLSKYHEVISEVKTELERYGIQVPNVTLTLGEGLPSYSPLKKVIEIPRDIINDMEGSVEKGNLVSTIFKDILFHESCEAYLYSLAVDAKYSDLISTFIASSFTGLRIKPLYYFLSIMSKVVSVEDINKIVINPRFLSTIDFLNKLKKKELVLVSAFLICKGGENYG